MRAKPSAELVAVDSRQHDIENEQVVIVFHRAGKGVLAVVNHIDRESFLA